MTAEQTAPQAPQAGAINDQLILLNLPDKPLVIGRGHIAGFAPRAEGGTVIWQGGSSNVFVVIESFRTVLQLVSGQQVDVVQDAPQQEEARPEPGRRTTSGRGRGRRS